MIELCQLAHARLLGACVRAIRLEVSAGAVRSWERLALL